MVNILTECRKFLNFPFKDYFQRINIMPNMIFSQVFQTCISPDINRAKECLPTNQIDLHVLKNKLIK